MAKSDSNAKSILQLALEKSPLARPAYLDNACGADTELHQEVKRLLASHHETPDFADVPTDVDGPGVGEDEPETQSLIADAKLLDTQSISKGKTGEPIGSRAGVTVGRFGDYELLEEIGVGGMGIVFKARQISLNRIVALKVIKAGELASPEALDRFQKEAEAVASLEHPGIVPAFEVGVHEGQNYFSMGYVEGENLADRLKHGPLAAREAAQLGRTIAIAVDYAHVQGIVHRDLKPGNILITTAGVPRITDFGLAKMIEEDSGLTHTGQILGTPSYMAPEQAAGSLNVGPAADVYALGAVLYHLLTGRPPFQAANVVETIRQVIDRDPIVPRQLNPTIPRDLETICLKCLNKSADRRYESAGKLADDIGRWLGNEPIVARPIGRTERSLRWCQRHPAVASLLALVILVATVGFTLVAWQWQRAEANLIRREVNFKRALDAVDGMLTRVGNESLANVPGMSQIRRQLLQDALRFYEGFLLEQSDDPEIVAETAEAYRRIGLIHKMLEEHDEALKVLKQAIALIEPLQERYPNRLEFRLELAILHSTLGQVLRTLSRFEESETTLLRAIDLYRAISRDFPRDTEARFEMASTMTSLGRLLTSSQRRGEAEEKYRKALAIYDDLDEATTATAPCRARWSDCHFNLAELLIKTGKRNDSELHYTEALLLRKSLASEFPNETNYRQDLARSHRVLGEFLIDDGRLDEARRFTLAAMSTFETLVTEFPNVPQHRVDLASCCNSSAIIYVRLGHSAGIQKFFGREVSIYEELVAEFPQRSAYQKRLALACYNLGLLKYESQKKDESRELQERSLVLRRQLAEERPGSHSYRSDVAISCVAVANLLTIDRDDEQVEEAKELLREAIRLGETLVLEAPDIPRYQFKLAQGYRSLARMLGDVDPQQAESYFLKALSSFEKLSAEYPEDTHYRRYISLSNKSLGHLHFSHGDTVAATDAYRKGCDIMEKLVSDFEEVSQFRREHATARISLGRALGLTGKQNEAAAILQQAVNELVELDEKTPEHSLVEYHLNSTYSLLARLFSNWMPAESRDQALAVEYAEKAAAGKYKNASVRTTLGMVRYHSGDWTDAKRILIPKADETDWLFISMCESHLGHPMEAVHWYEKAVDAINISPLTNLELQRYRRQAEALLDLPTDQ